MATIIGICPECKNNEFFFTSALLEKHLQHPRYNTRQINCYNCKKEIKIKDCISLPEQRLVS
jgi:hypothetical protein